MAVVPEAKERVLRLIDFLAAYDARKNPPVRDIATYRLYLLRDRDLARVPGVRLSPAGDAWLTVDFVELPSRPSPPPSLESALEGLDSAAAPHRPEVTLPDEPTEDDLAVAERAEQWVADTWDPWAERYRQAQATKRLYRDLFEQRERLAVDRDSVELVWGFGRMQWQPEGGEPIDHPALSIPVEIDVDETTAQLRVRPAGAVELESLYLADVSVDDRQGFTAIRQSLVELDEPVDPWDQVAVADVLRRVVRSLDHNGAAFGEGDAVSGAAAVDESWVLFLRRRRPDYQGFLDELRELYKSGAIPPDPLQALVVDAPSLLVDDEFDESPADRTYEPLLLPLATNEEQQRILTLAQRRPGVTVQGPPGTGKSHTIANIISHYVAYGHRVLVVAEKEQALRVLAEKIPPGIRDLTVSVLGADEDGRRRLESSIGQIQTRVTAIDKRFVDEQIARLTGELDRIDRAIAETTNRLLAASVAEAGPIRGHWIAGNDPSPIVAAQWVARNADGFGYIDDRLAPGTAQPIGSGDLAEFVTLIEQLGVERAEACAFELPALDSLPTAATLAHQFAELDSLRSELGRGLPEITSWERLDSADIDLVKALATALADEHAWAIKTAGTWLDRVRDQAADPLLRDEWLSFTADARGEREQVVTVGRELEAHAVTTPDNPPTAFADRLRDAKDRLADKGKLGWFSGETKRALEECSVDGRVPAIADDVELCLLSLRRAELRRLLMTRWANRMARVDGPVIDGLTPEDVVGRHLDDLDRQLALPTRWAQLVGALGSLDISHPAQPGPDELARLADVLRIATLRPAERAATRQLDGLQNALAAGATRQDASPLWRLLADALETRRTEAWDQHRGEVADLTAIAPQALRLRNLRRDLHGAAPLWTTRIAASPAAAGDPGDLGAAWEWRQLETWLQTIDQGDDPAELQRRLEELSAERRRAVTDLVTERAWRRLADNIGDRQRQALNSYLAAVKRYGKTGGKFAARWLTQIRQALNESKDAVPVWIMPTSRALASFRPDRIPPFDVLVIDEASQIGLEALPLLSLARTTIVVGDDKQTSPENVGLDRQSVFNLLDEYLSVVPKYQTLFDADNSLYDLAFQKFPDVVMLTEHFRCLPPIIQFSNLHAYDGRIVPLRDQPPAPGWTPLGAIKVLDGYRVGDVNEAEAHAVVELIEQLCADPDYDGMDFGVVSLLGSSQSKLIWEQLYDRLGPDVINQRRLRCGEPANFQGDERDVMIISTVVATDPNNPGGRIGAMTGRPAERRINVAASRARDQMWIVHSVDADRFPKGDLRAELIRHCQNRGLIEADQQNLEAACESDFERKVVGRILARGYRGVKVQHHVGRFRIDIVVEGPDARLAVECDGDRWHGDDVWHQDRARQQVLERAGWTFERIRGSSFYRNPDRALEPLWARLDELGIPTGDEWLTSNAQSTMRTVTGRRDLAALPDDSGGDLEDEDREIGAHPREDAPTEPTARRSRSEVLEQRDSRDLRAVPPRIVAIQPEIPELSWVAPTLDGDLARAEPLTSRAARDPNSSNATLAPYLSWSVRSLPEVDFATPAEIVAGLAEIVAAEGPMHALRAYQLYVKASGGQRVGKEMRRSFNQATNRALRSRALSQISDGVAGQIDKTLYAPGRAQVLVRELGPRQLTEVPRSEIQTLIDRLGITGSPQEMKRAVLDAFGLTRLTERASDYLDSCLA